MVVLSATELTANADSKIVRKRVTSLKPSPENLQLYRAVDDDPEIGKLADSIQKNSCVPLVVTRDNYIVSGHRRHAALLLIDRRFVECIVLLVRRDSMTRDEYVVLPRGQGGMAGAAASA
jgi:hypothetical protein